MEGRFSPGPLGADVEQNDPGSIRSTTISETLDWGVSPSATRHHPRDMDIKLEPEFYTCAFVSPLHLGQKRDNYERISGECFFTLAMLFVATMQCITVSGMSAYLVEKDRGFIDEFKLSTVLFVEGEATLPLGAAQDLCGSFSHIGMHKLGHTNSLAMGDGTMYAGTAATPAFHSYKMPSGAWGFESISKDESYVDKLLRVLHDNNWQVKSWLSTVTDFRVEYGVLLVVMVAVLWFHVLFEFRKIARFGLVLSHLFKKGLIKGRLGTTSYDPIDGAISIEYLNLNAMMVGCLCVLMRLSVVFWMITWGTSLLAASTNKLSLVLNSLAIGIVFELDVIVAYAVVDHNTMTRVEEIKPITIRIPSWSLADNTKRMNHWDIAFSFLMLIGVLLGSCLVRKWQVDDYHHQLNNAAALCLFAGPAPLGLQNVIAPVPGFCESLLSLTCAPNVTGIGSEHGPCLVTDQHIFKAHDVMLHADGPLFDNMVDSKGKRQSMAAWGKPHRKLTEKNLWVQDDYLTLFRRACVQLYQPVGAIDKRVVDSGSGLTMYSAPFYCPKKDLFQAVFANSVKDFDKWSTTFDLQKTDVVKALDGCRLSSLDSVTETQSSALLGAAPAPAPAASPAAAPAAQSEGDDPVPINALAESTGGDYQLATTEGGETQAKKTHVRHHRPHRAHHRAHHEVSQQLVRER